jgi:type I restriction enzyme M protein
MNLLIHEVEDAQIRREDTLNNPKFVDSKGRLDQFDVVVANPPFSLKDWGANKWANDPHNRVIGGIPPKNNGDFAWIQHMLASMKPETGRVGVVMPHGVLFRGGAEGAIRKHLIESDLLETVIGLAPNLFYGTSIPASLLIFRASKPQDRRGQILFIDSSKRFNKGKAQNFLTIQDVEDVFEVYGSLGESERPDIATRLVPLNEVRDNNWDLNIGRYLKADAEAIIDVKAALLSFEASRVELATAEKALLESLRAAGYE